MSGYLNKFMTQAEPLCAGVGPRQTDIYRCLYHP